MSQHDGIERYPGQTSVTTTMKEATWDAAPHSAADVEVRTCLHESHPSRGSPEGPLIARLRAAEVGAIEELYLAYKKPIFGFLYRLARDRHLAEDLFQNTWVKVSRSVGRLREDTQLKAWLFTVARNEFRSYRRWQLIDLSRVFLFYREREQPRLEPVRESDESVVLGGIEQGLAALGAADREVLLLVCVEGMDAQQAATVLGITHAALRQRLTRARARLKDALSKLESECGAGKHTPARKR